MPSGPRRAFWISVCLSIVIHAGLMTGLSGVLLAPTSNLPELTVEMQRIEPPPPPRPPQPAPQPRPGVKPPAKVRAAATAPTPPAVMTEAASVRPQPETAHPETVSPAEPAVAPEVPDATSQPPVAMAEETAAGDTPEAPADALPSRGTIVYDLLYGGGSIGRSIQTWHIEGSTYRLSSVAQTTGLLAALFPYQYVHVSEGSIGPDGFRPRKFTTQRGRGGSRQSAAEFDWNRGEIVLGPLGTPRTLALPAGTQDLLTFIYQLARRPIEPGRQMMVITTGHKLDTYVLDIGREASVDLPMGSTRAIPIRQISAPGEEHMELWLAVEPPRLPVRIRFFDRTGQPTVEQIATKIDIHGT